MQKKKKMQELQKVRRENQTKNLALNELQADEENLQKDHFEEMQNK